MIRTSLPQPTRRSRYSRAKSVSESVSETIRTTKKRILFEFHEVEAWQRDNEFLRGKYRTVSGSYIESLKSIFYLHNQTGNIYSHLIGAVISLVYAFYVGGTILNRYPTADVYDLLAFGVFLGSAFICFGLSASFHIFGNHSNEVYHTWLMFDLYGIFVLIVGTVYSGTYYGFYCEPQYWRTYSVGIAVVVCACATLCSIPRFRAPQWRWARASVFTAIGWLGALPMTHAAQSWGIEQAHKQMGWWYLILEGLSYGSGAALYAVRFPERLRPGLFDIWGSSHQLFHVLTVCAAACHLIGLLKAFDYNHDPLTRRCLVPEAPF
ncbi:mPR-like GPCR protein [Aaosphaeria arxii CBS 175.79]|uniref:MPR-like GPCR protein n=1 Tax=Aaosphaeria arxii CBS 175.79 TaxID=1450172 RepID=A0A6A5Y2W6_9PLEO|nr:mPR-like GPCR protein [Aaosphaeria arxii CBS 175.79]KAF2019241.1 mPR-like GPCR protein [Aaosphaeria arxii CBS 175.79]